MTHREAIAFISPETSSSEFLRIRDDIDMEAAMEIHNEACRMAAAALEKQIPMKPQSAYYFREKDRVCPACETDTSCRIVFLWQKYCPDCGQAIDWRDYEQ